MKSHSFYNLIFCRIQLAGCFLFFSFTAFSQQTLRTNLFIVSADGSKTLIDGNMTIYDDIYCNCVNWEDALKFTNPGMNWGLVRNGTTLAVERRRFIPDSDTSFIRMWNLQQYNYRIQIIGQNLSKTDRTGYVRDSYTNISIPINLNDTTYIDFSVNSNSGTSVQNRFSIIFEKNVHAPMPVIFTGIKLLRKDASVNVEFEVENELLVTGYMIQYAKDTSNFKDAKSVKPRNGSSSEIYKEVVSTCSEGDNFYRIKATNAGGKITYSSVAKLSMPRAVPCMNVYPNPITSRQIQLQTTGVQEGKYLVRLIGMDGTVYPIGNMQLIFLQSSHLITLPAGITSGLYRIQLIGPNNVMVMKSITIL